MCLGAGSRRWGSRGSGDEGTGKEGECVSTGLGVLALPISHLCHPSLPTYLRGRDRGGTRTACRRRGRHRRGGQGPSGGGCCGRRNECCVDSFHHHPLSLTAALHDGRRLTRPSYWHGAGIDAPLVERGHRLCRLWFVGCVGHELDGAFEAPEDNLS